MVKKIEFHQEIASERKHYIDPFRKAERVHKPKNIYESRRDSEGEAPRAPP